MPKLAANQSYVIKLYQLLFKQVDNSPLIFFRICFGFLLFYHCISYMVMGKVYQYFIEPPFTFTYIGFEWLQPLPGNGMYFYFGVMALLALLIMLGAWYRLAIISFAILWTGIYLMQKSGYNNHYYLVCLLCWLMCLLPAQAAVSVDARRTPGLKRNHCSQWIYYLFVSQTAIIYFYAAISKLNADWLSGKFIALQFSRLSTHRLLGFIYGDPLFQKFICYGGMLFDLLIVPLLLWKKTRVPAFVLFCLFHLFNAYSFRIGIFPFLSIAMAVFFFDPALIRKTFFANQPLATGFTDDEVKITFARRTLLIVLAVYISFQIYLPMRSWFYPGHVFWTEEGYRMSWKMMLRKKTGTITFNLHDPVSGKTWPHDPLTRFKPAHVYWIAICPDIVWQYAQHLKQQYNKMGYPQIQVFAIDSVRLNDSPPQLLIDPTADLANIPWHRFKHSQWLLPFKETNGQTRTSDHKKTNKLPVIP